MNLQNVSALLALPAALLMLTLPARASYCLRAENGQIAAFDLSSGACVSTFDTPVSSLRHSDRALLAEGLYFSSIPELTQACEDFCS